MLASSQLGATLSLDSLDCDALRLRVLVLSPMEHYQELHRRLSDNLTYCGTQTGIASLETGLHQRAAANRPEVAIGCIEHRLVCHSCQVARRTEAVVTEPKRI